MHKEFKDGYRWSNKVNAIPQIITTYTRDHTFASDYLAIKTWTHVQQDAPSAQGLGLQSTSSPVFLNLKGKNSSGITSNLNDLEQEAGLKNLESAKRLFFIR